LALYNIDSSKRNPIIKHLASPTVQKRIKGGDLHIRMIFEGYESKEKNLEKMLELEKLGIDVRALGSSRKMHHKFAVIDGHKRDGSVITGSANWSMMSFRNYNENTLYFDNEGEMTQEFQKEFDILWGASQEVGRQGKVLSYKFEKPSKSIGTVTFNRDNFTIKNGRISKKRGDKGYRLTDKIVRAIDEADHTLEIASTRFKLRPIYNAVLRAAKRGVDIKVLVTMGEYEWPSQRRKMQVKDCYEYDRKCSTSQNYAAFLAKGGFPGEENVKVRVKFFNLNTMAYLNKQMHSKYIIVDNKTVVTGSFNWSYSSEFNHIENLIKITERESFNVVDDFNYDFDYMWDQDREALSPLHALISEVKENNEKMSCGFDPMALTYKEIDGLLRRGRKFCR
jgi:phosphatidylserine/phosphatidylglycerophosphate/cardiolipin synthase-like enzyme